MVLGEYGTKEKKALAERAGREEEEAWRENVREALTDLIKCRVVVLASLVGCCVGSQKTA